MFAYEADALPVDAGWEVFDPCTPPCSEQIVNGQLVLEWPANFSDVVNYHRFISQPPDLPPDSLWVEWRFKSIRERPVSGFTCDSRVTVAYFVQPKTVLLYGDGAEAPGGEGFVFGLPVDTFRTFRFESTDGQTFAFFIDGAFLFGASESPLENDPYIQFGGRGACWPSLVERNTWDYVRYGTIMKGEGIIASDPLSGVLSSLEYPSLDRFAVTFDAPNYVKVSEIAVLQTRRNDNYPPDTLEILLDQPLTVGETTTFTFNDGEAINIVEYTLEPGGACCAADGTCEVVTESACADPGDAFLPGGACDAPKACCMPDGSCALLDPICCAALGGTAQAVSICEGDMDQDGVDGLCGDECPLDPDDDKDGDGICGDADACPNLNPNDANGNGEPDCEEVIIPTLSIWGLLVLTLVLAITAKLAFRKKEHAP